ncbi:MAG: hypothetical protein ACXQTH_00030 [Dehalococcoidia bacterium]
MARTGRALKYSDGSRNPAITIHESVAWKKIRRQEYQESENGDEGKIVHMNLAKKRNKEIKDKDRKNVTLRPYENRRGSNALTNERK